MEVELSSVIGIYLRRSFVYYQSIMVLVKVNVDALIQLSQINTFASPDFSVSREYNSLAEDFENGTK